jgi:hypothetical protein
LQHGPVDHDWSGIPGVEHDLERVGDRLAEQPQASRPDPQLGHCRLACREVEDPRPHGRPELLVRIVDLDAGPERLVAGVGHGEPVLADPPALRGPRDQLGLDGAERLQVQAGVDPRGRRRVGSGGDLDAEGDAAGRNARRSRGSEPDADHALVIGHELQRARVDLSPGRGRAEHLGGEVVHHPAVVADLKLGLDLAAGGDVQVLGGQSHADRGGGLAAGAGVGPGRLVPGKERPALGAEAGVVGILMPAVLADDHLSFPPNVGSIQTAQS